MDIIGWLIAQLLLLFWLSSQLHQQLSRAVYGVFRSYRLTVWLMSLLFLLGTLVHELAHLIVARLLLVKAGRLTIIPKIESDGRVVMGSVQMPATDPIRRFLIGIAPVYVGLGLLWFILWQVESRDALDSWKHIAVIGFVIFQLSNTLFASRKDMEGAFGLFMLVAILVGLSYWLGWQIPLANIEYWIVQNQQLFGQLVNWLWVPIAIDLAALGLLWVISRMFSIAPFYSR